MNNTSKTRFVGPASGAISEPFLDHFSARFCHTFWNRLFQAVCGFGAQSHAQRRSKGSKHEPESDPGSILCNVLEAWYLLHRKHIGASRDGSGDQVFAAAIPRRFQDGSRDKLLLIFEFLVSLEVLSGAFFRLFFSMGNLMRFSGMRRSASHPR